MRAWERRVAGGDTGTRKDDEIARRGPEREKQRDVRLRSQKIHPSPGQTPAEVAERPEKSIKRDGVSEKCSGTSKTGKLKCPGLDLGKGCFREQKMRGREKRESQTRKTWPSPVEEGEDPWAGIPAPCLFSGSRL